MPKTSTNPISPHTLAQIWKNIGPQSRVDSFPIVDKGSIITEVETGHDVFVQSSEYAQALEDKDPKASLKTWKARVKEIREVPAGRLVKVQWYYSFEHAKEGLMRLDSTFALLLNPNLIFVPDQKQQRAH
ncbi:hypothetical protein VKT23_015168 [Stygiomarasmius scandens]|uniref:Uncharacterized protein n=1 Tax=Marasmiellus scandens TaxID=2682957 RepID=A0ABR1J162_9AGAR